MPPTSGSPNSRNPDDDLQLILEDGLDPVVASLCRQERDSLAAALARWGRFRRPVDVRTTADRDVLRSAAGTSSSELLCALATLDTVTLLAPQMWANTPAHGDLYRAVLHELAHVLMFQRCAAPSQQRASSLPVWFREGMAVFVAEGPPSPNLRRQVADRTDLGALTRADAAVMAADSPAVYVVARLLFAAWLERFGDRRYAALCREMRSGVGFRRAHQRACGVSEEAFTTEWTKEVQAEARTR